MSKIDKLKHELIKYNRTKSICQATDICDWLVKELLKPEKKIPVTYISRIVEIEVREG